MIRGFRYSLEIALAIGWYSRHTNRYSLSGIFFFFFFFASFSYCYYYLEALVIYVMRLATEEIDSTPRTIIYTGKSLCNLFRKGF